MKNNPNFDRAARAYMALDAYTDNIAKSDSDVEIIIIRLLADLRHYCEYTSIDFPECILCSHELYQQDIIIQSLQQEL